MKDIKMLREERASIAQNMKALLDDSRENDKQWTADDQTKYDNMLSDVENIDKEIANIQKYLDAVADDRVIESVDEALANRGASNQLRELHNKWLRKGDRALSAEEWQMIRNTMSTTTDAEGGYTVQTEVAQMVMDALKSYGGMRKVATVISTEGGNAITYPTSDGTAEEGEQVAENVSATDADPDFGGVTLATYKYSSKVVTVPFELLQDSNIDVEGFVNKRLTQRIGRITNKKFTIGTGTGEPRGIQVAAAAGKVGATGQTTTVTFEDLVDLEHSVDVEYREQGNCTFMMNDATFKVIKKLKDDQGRPIFIPGWDGLAGPVPQTIMGYPVVINNNLPVMAADAKSILFGDFTYYIIRDVMNLTMFRFNDSAYAKKGQVGFLMWSRHGGNFTDVGGAVKYYQNSST